MIVGELRGAVQAMQKSQEDMQSQIREDRKDDLLAHIELSDRIGAMESGFAHMRGQQKEAREILERILAQTATTEDEHSDRLAALERKRKSISSDDETRAMPRPPKAPKAPSVLESKLDQPGTVILKNWTFIALEKIATSAIIAGICYGLYAASKVLIGS